MEHNQCRSLFHFPSRCPRSIVRAHDHAQADEHIEPEICPILSFVALSPVFNINCG
jgi:hypothetical protein